MATVHGENVRVYKRAAQATRRTLCGLAALVPQLGRHIAVAALASVIAGNVACGDACHSLAVQICNCGRTQIEQASCIQRVNTDSSANVTAADRKVCENLQHTCTCQALSEGNLAACGLSNE
jgi:hypothetical protein